MAYDLADENATSQDAIQQTLVAWADAMLRLPVIIAHPGAPRPTPPYVLINLISASRAHEMGDVLHEAVTVDGEERIVERHAEDWQWTASVQTFGKRALDNARVLTNSLRAGGVWVDHLAPLDVREVTMIRRVPELINEAWQERANFDVTVSGVVLDGFLVDVVESGSIFVARKIGDLPAVGKDVTMTYQKPAP